MDDILDFDFFDAINEDISEEKFKANLTTVQKKELVRLRSTNDTKGLATFTSNIKKSHADAASSSLETRPGNASRKDTLMANLDGVTKELTKQKQSAMARIKSGKAGPRERELWSEDLEESRTKTKNKISKTSSVSKTKVLKPAEVLPPEKRASTPKQLPAGKTPKQLEAPKEAKKHTGGTINLGGRIAGSDDSNRAGPPRKVVPKQLGPATPPPVPKPTPPPLKKMQPPPVPKSLGTATQGTGDSKFASTNKNVGKRLDYSVGGRVKAAVSNFASKVSNIGKKAKAPVTQTVGTSFRKDSALDSPTKLRNDIKKTPEPASSAPEVKKPSGGWSSSKSVDDLVSGAVKHNKPSTPKSSTTPETKTLSPSSPTVSKVKKATAEPALAKKSKTSKSNGTVISGAVTAANAARTVINAGHKIGSLLKSKGM